MTHTIEFKTDTEIKEKLERMAHVLHNLRFFTKYWNEHGGCHARSRMKYWQEQADDLLNSMGITLHNNINKVVITKSIL